MAGHKSCTVGEARFTVAAGRGVSCLRTIDKPCTVENRTVSVLPDLTRITVTNRRVAGDGNVDAIRGFEHLNGYCSGFIVKGSNRKLFVDGGVGSRLTLHRFG